MTADQLNRTLNLVNSLRRLPVQDALRSLDLSVDDGEIRDEVRHRLVGSIGLTGLTFGRYVIGEPLGSGAFGEVYQARDTVLGRAVALKFLLPSRRGHTKLLEEAQAASALNHPNIVTVHEVLVCDAGPVMVMELVEGSSLRKVLAEPLPPARAHRYAIQLMEALSAAHAAGIVHRDLKPENLMIRPDGYLKVLDFGMALKKDDQDEAGKLLGTPRYMSPEQCLGKPATPASDMFAAGLIIYEMASGKHPFGDASPAETAREILRSEPKPKGGGPLIALAMQLLDKDPARRPAAAQSLKLLEAGTRRNWRFALSAAALLLILAGAAALWLRGRKPVTGTIVFTPLTSTSADTYITAESVSPDGSRCALADAEGVVRLRSLSEDVSHTEILQIPNERIDRLSWIGRAPLLIVSSHVIQSDSATGRLRLLDLNSRRLTDLALSGREALASPDGSRLAYITVDGRAIEIASLERAKVLCRIQVDDPTGIKGLAWSPSGSLLHYWTIPEGRVAWHRWKSTVLHTVDASSGQLRLGQTLPPLLCAVITGDGRLIYQSTMSGVMEVETDPVTGRLKGEARPIGLIAGLERDLSASADGRTIAGIGLTRSTISVYVGDLSPSTYRLASVRLLSPVGAGAFAHSWTPDNQAVIYESSQYGTQDLFRHSLNQKRPERIVDMPEQQVMAHVSPDGQSVVFLSSVSGLLSDGIQLWRLLRMPLAGGPIVEVPNTGPVQEFNCEYRAVRCVIREYRQGEMMFFEMDPVRGKGRELARIKSSKPEFGDWVLSPDGRKVSLVDLSRLPAAIRVLDLDHPGNEGRIEIEGPIPVGGLASWSIDGKGWFLAQDRDRMMFYDAQGRPHFVHDGALYVVPSWDGKKAAIIERDREADAYWRRR